MCIDYGLLCFTRTFHWHSKHGYLSRKTGHHPASGRILLRQKFCSHRCLDGFPGYRSNRYAYCMYLSETGVEKTIASTDASMTLPVRETAGLSTALPVPRPASRSTGCFHRTEAGRSEWRLRLKRHYAAKK